MLLHGPHGRAPGVDDVDEPLVEGVVAQQRFARVVHREAHVEGLPRKCSEPGCLHFSAHASSEASQRIAETCAFPGKRDGKVLRVVAESRAGSRPTLKSSGEETACELS